MTQKTTRQISIDLPKADRTSVAFMTLLIDRQVATNKRRECFEHISKEEFAHFPLPKALLTFGAIPPVSVT